MSEIDDDDEPIWVFRMTHRHKFGRVFVAAPDAIMALSKIEDMKAPGFSATELKLLGDFDDFEREIREQEVVQITYIR